MFKETVVIQSLRAFRRAWDLGSRALGEGTCGTMAWDLVSRVAWMQWPHGGLLEVSWGSFLASWGSPRAALGRSRAVLGRPCRRLGGLLELLKMLGRLRGCFQGLMEATGEAFGRRWVLKWSPFWVSFQVIFHGHFWCIFEITF